MKLGWLQLCERKIFSSFFLLCRNMHRKPESGEWYSSFTHSASLPQADLYGVQSVTVEHFCSDLLLGWSHVLFCGACAPCPLRCLCLGDCWAAELASELGLCVPALHPRGGPCYSHTGGRRGLGLVPRECEHVPTAKVWPSSVNKMNVDSLFFRRAYLLGTDL
jgi:hypothetical protein